MPLLAVTGGAVLYMSGSIERSHYQLGSRLPEIVERRGCKINFIWCNWGTVGTSERSDEFNFKMISSSV